MRQVRGKKKIPVKWSINLFCHARVKKKACGFVSCESGVMGRYMLPLKVTGKKKTQIFGLLVILKKILQCPHYINPFTPNDHYNGRTAPLNCERCILYIYIYIYIFNKYRY